VDDDEKAALSTFLDAQRGVVWAILDGLDEEALTTAVLPSGWAPLGLVEHLGYAERYWFQEALQGHADPLPWPDDPEPFTTPRSSAEVFVFYRDQCERSNAILATTPLDTRLVGRPPGTPEDDLTNLRRIVLHMIEETARHAGHLDAWRELLDGTTGLGPR
jgi:hypothetical protein